MARISYGRVRWVGLLELFETGGQRTRTLDSVTHGRDRHRTRRQIVPVDPENLDRYRWIAPATG